EPALILGGADFNAPAPGDSGESQLSSSAEQLVFAPLDGTVEEAIEIARILNLPRDRVLIGQEADEGRVKKVSGPRILHLATHGFFLRGPPDMERRHLPRGAYIEDPMLRSGLALSGANNRHAFEGPNDGVLTALEVAGLDLWGTEVVTLSACESGLGEVKNGEGVYGLRRALVLAGAKTQVMTLWKVDDNATRDLMISWYAQLRQGVGRAEAMRRVQLAALKGEQLPVIGKHLRSPGVKLAGAGAGTQDKALDSRLVGARHPYYWASFIVSGETGPLSPDKMKAAQ
ncbi:MAG: CHAT domain-containing protein, partial [Acidobacteriota bacterium]